MELIKRYGIFGTIRLIINVLISKLFISASARIVRYPFYVRGNRNIDWGNNLTAGTNLRIDAFTHLQKNSKKKNKKIIRFGNHVELNDYVHIAGVEKIEIGNKVLIASKVFITDHSHGEYSAAHNQSNPNTPPSERKIISKPVIIKDNVWIGEQTAILPGVIIGEGSIIGALSLVNKNIPPYSIAVGSPARVIKTFNFGTGKWEKI